MKKIYSIILILLISYPSFAQNGTGFNYQAVVRDAGGNIKANQSLSMEITILQGSVDGTAVFAETHQVVSNTQGIINLIVGSVNPASFALINWANGPYFIQISIDGVEFGTSQLNSVPYALHSKTVENYTETDPLFSASPLKDITQAEIEEWSKKIDSITEVDPLFAASPSAGITEADISNWMNKLSEFVETDPIFSASIAKGITSQDTAYWNSKFNELIEADPIFAASVAKGISGIDTSYWNGKLDEFIESDPLFAAHPTSSITEDDITTWKYLWFWYVANGNSFLKIASPAGGITASDTARWNSSANAGLPNTIADADGNTKVQVEETADENKIRFDINGTERWVMDSTRLEPRNTGGSVFIGENAGLKDDLSANNNTFIGFEAGKENTTGENNTANGYQALSSNTTGLFNTANGGYALKNNIGGNYNTANGYYSLFSNSNGSRNTANGYYAIYSNTLGISNTANGLIALYSNTTGNNNTAYGSAALFTNTNGNNNTANGYEALFSNTTGSGNVALGFQAGYNETSSNKLYIDNSNTAKPLIYGDFSADSLLINGMLIVDSTLKIKGGSPGVGKVLTSDAIGLASWEVVNPGPIDTTSIIQDANRNTKIQVEETADENKIRFDINGTERWVMDSTRLEPRNTGGSVFIGENAGLKDDLSANNNTFIGFEAGKENTTGENNTANGYQALSSNATGFFNTANGGSALKNNIGGNYNTANGYYSLFSNSNGSRNTANGYYAIYSNTIGVSNTANGFIALYSNSTGDNNTAYGSAALYSNTTGSGNVALGFQAGYYETSSNKLYIDNSSSTTPLIYGDFSADSLRINGMLVIDSTLKIEGGSPGVGKVLTSDANGLASWASPSVASGLLAFAGFYALMPPDNAATVAPGSAIEFPQDGPSSGTITRSSPSHFILPDIGVYMVNWQVSINEPGQLALELDGIQIDYTVVGRATGTSQITGNSLITTTTVNSVLRVINPAGNPAALTVTPLAGGAYPVAASLVITRIQ